MNIMSGESVDFSRTLLFVRGGMLVVVADRPARYFLKQSTTALCSTDIRCKQNGVNKGVFLHHLFIVIHLV